MKYKLIITGMALILALSLLAACAPSNEMSLEITCEDFEKDSHHTWTISGASEGDLVKVILCSNPTTGFGWELAGITDEGVIELEGEPEFVAQQTLAGAPGKETWVFKAIEKGESTAVLEYSRGWEGGEKAVRTMEINVTVE